MTFLDEKGKRIFARALSKTRLSTTTYFLLRTTTANPDLSSILPGFSVTRRTAKKQGPVLRFHVNFVALGLLNRGLFMPCGKTRKAAYIATTVETVELAENGDAVPARENQKSSVGPLAAFGEPLETAEASPKMARGSLPELSTVRIFEVIFF